MKSCKSCLLVTTNPNKKNFRCRNVKYNWKATIAFREKPKLKVINFCLIISKKKLKRKENGAFNYFKKMLKSIEGNFDNPEVNQLLTKHFIELRAASPEGSAHVLDIPGLKELQ